MNEGLKHLLKEQDKRNGVTPKRIFVDMLVGLTIKTNDQYPDSIFYWKNGHIWFQQDNKNGDLWCSYEHVWSIFHNKFGFDYNETQKIIKGLLENISGWKELKPLGLRGVTRSLLENISGWKELFTTLIKLKTK